MANERAIEIGARIQAVRKSLNMNQDQFAEKMSLSQNQISRLENGANMVTTEFVLKLYDLYGIDPSTILVGKSVRGLDVEMEKFISWYEGLDDTKAKGSACHVCEGLMSFLSGE